MKSVDAVTEGIQKKKPVTQNKSHRNPLCTDSEKDDLANENPVL